jgi:hypothetical protein
VPADQAADDVRGLDDDDVMAQPRQSRGDCETAQPATDDDDACQVRDPCP